MATQTDQKSLLTRPGEQQTQSSQRRDMARSSPGSGYLQRRGEYPSGLAPQELFRANPFSLLRRMTEEMDRMFQEAGLDREGSGGNGWSPAIEVSLRDGMYNIHAELPGLDPKDVKVEVENDALVIRGERRSEYEEREGGVQRTERQYGFFYRSIPLPEGAKLDQAKARFNNGVLEITIPVPEQQSNRRSIPVEGESGGVSSKPPQSQAA
ncbi:MAG: heat shock protein Hsp20 [Edaphobacter sp.]|nr:heat shock protein Hsp20 [Edaphobacter sp.]